MLKSASFRVEILKGTLIRRAQQSIIRAKLRDRAVPAAAITSERGNFAIAAVVPAGGQAHG